MGKRAAVYLRISKDRDKKEEGVDRQREDCLKLCRRRGWEPVEYMDNDFSAFSGRRRPAYQRMLADIASGAVQAMVVYDQDRLDKGGLEAEQFINLADQHEIALASVGGDFDLSTDQGRLQYRVKAAFSRAEMERKSARQKRQALQAAQMGKTRGGPRAFGYEPDGMTLRASEADALRAAYGSLLAGRTLVGLCRDLAEAGLTTPAGRPFRHSGIRSILLNPRNAGLRSYTDTTNGRVIRERERTIVGPAQWPGVVDAETFYAAQALLNDPARRKNTNTGTARRWLLGGLALCGRCEDGTTVRVNYRSENRDGEPVRVYRCRVSAHLSREASFCDERVTDRVIARLSRADARDLLVDDDREDLAALRAEEATLRTRLEQLAESFADGTLTPEQLRAGTDRLRARLADLETRMVHTDRAPLLADLVTASDVRAVWDSTDLDRQRAVIDLLYTVTLLPRGPGRAVVLPETVQMVPKV